MSFDEDLADRVRQAIGHRTDLTERKMFGGLAFLLRGNMCCGVLRDDLIVRIPPDETAAALAEPHTRPFDFTGRPMRGFVVVEPSGWDDDDALAGWVARAAEFAAALPPK
jgi:TfoX/Sxy family transcriptional regulator of competence genes